MQLNNKTQKKIFLFLQKNLLDKNLSFDEHLFISESGLIIGDTNSKCQAPRIYRFPGKVSVVARKQMENYVPI